jgi:hypothetical protein
VVRKLRVGRLHDISWIRAWCDDQRNLNAFFAILRHADRGRFPHAGNVVDDPLDVFGKDVEAFRRHDHFLLAAADEEPSAFIDLADVPRMEPAAFECRFGRLRRSVIPGRDVVAADENFAVGRNPHVHAADRFADRSFAGRKRMIERDDRGGLGQAVTLDDDESKAAPEGFERPFERRSPDDERPEFQAEQAMHGTVAPPSLRDALVCRGVSRTSGCSRAT